MELKEIDIRSGDLSGLDITKQQARTIRAIIDALPEFDFYGRPDQYEIKSLRLSITDRDTFDDIDRDVLGSHRFPVYLVTETGMVDDEGTMAELYCRKYRHLYIGPRGGIRNMHTGRSNHPWPVSLFDAMNRCHYDLMD